jgi:hypothetical protein
MRALLFTAALVAAIAWTGLHLSANRGLHGILEKLERQGAGVNDAVGRAINDSVGPRRGR